MNFYNEIDKLCLDLDKLCLDLDKCQIQNCERLHPRCFRGICIGFLKGICQQQEYCGQYHYLQEQLKDLLQDEEKPPINGIYQHNLCYKKCIDENCKYLHPPWLQYICVECENNKCDKKKGGLWHTRNWLVIQKKVYELYNLTNSNPEKFCDEINCQCDAKIYNFDTYCIKYFKGICSYHRCQKPHKNWEDLKNIGNFSNIQDQTIKPCIKFDQNKNRFVSQPQTLQSNIFMQKNQLQLMINQISQRPQVDIIFILDCTKSMEKWIQVSRNSISSIIAEFKKKVQINTAIRMAAVCYKDFSDGPNHIKYHNFTVRPEEIEKFIGNIIVEGGDDIPEDLQGALDVAYTLNICKDPESLLQLFIITDAPCHGRKYHKLAFDQNSKAQDLEEKLQKFVALKQRFYLSFLQINEQTQTMESVMQNVVQKNYQSAKIADKQFSDYILFSLSSTYCKSQSINNNKDYQHISQATYKKQKQMPYMFNNRQDYKYSDQINEQIQSTQKQNKTLLFIEYQEMPVSQKGQQVEVFKGFDQKNNLYVVIKIQKFIIQKYNSKTLTDDDIEKANQIANSKYRQQLIAKQLSNHFNYCCKLTEAQFIPLYYATPYLYELEKPFKGLKLIYAESYIDIDEPWKKYTNNAEYRDEQIDLTAFSHFTYHYTNQQMVITDLQGKTNILSDPAIHTQDQFFTDSANLKNDGCCRFFLNQHPVCQNICKQLGLPSIPIQQRSETQIENQNFEVDTQLDESFASQLNIEKLFKICSNCNMIEKLQQVSDIDEICGQCKDEQREIENMYCKCCNIAFQISQHFEQRFGTIVQYCQECQIKKCHLTQVQTCYYCEKKICLQTIKEIQYNNQNITICIDAYLYLRQFKCKNCQSNYKFDTLLSIDDYYKNNYNCGCNKNNK